MFIFDFILDYNSMFSLKINMPDFFRFKRFVVGNFIA